MSYRILGLDWFDVLVHGAVTLALGIGVDSMFLGPTSDFAMGVLLASSLGVLGWRRKRALALGAEPTDSGRWEAVEARMGEVDHLEQRVMELEERLDFTERMLAQARERDQARLPGS